MRHVAFSVSIIGVLVVLAACSGGGGDGGIGDGPRDRAPPQGERAGDLGEPPSIGRDSLASYLLDTVNVWRKDRGLSTLIVDPNLEAAAEWMAEDQVKEILIYPGYPDSLGRNTDRRLDDFGISKEILRGEL